VAITFVTSQRAASGSATSLSTGALSATTTDLVVAWCYWYDTAATCAMTWGGSPTFTSGTLATQNSVGHEARCQIFWTWGSAITSGTPTVTATLSGGGGAQLMNLEVLQIAGTLITGDPKDAEGSKATTGTVMTSNTFSTSVADTILVCGAFVNATGGCDTADAFGGVTGTIATCTAGYRIVSATQSSITVALANNGQDGAMSWAAFKIASGVGGGAATIASTSMPLMGVQ